MVSLSNHEPLVGSSFDRLRMSGEKFPLMVSLSNHELVGAGPPKTAIALTNRKPLR